MPRKNLELEFPAIHGIVDGVMDEKKRICIVTGANSGMGFETALSLALAGWEVVLGCRSFAKGNQAVMRIGSLLRQIDGGTKRGGASGKAVFMELALASFDSIRNFTAGFRKRYASCDLLVCNAGVSEAAHGFTEDGYETQFQVNYLGHAYLVRQLLPYLAAAGRARVVCVSCRSHEKIPYAAGDFLKAARCGREEYKASGAYSRSKLFLTAYVKKAQEAFGGDGLSFFAVDPGTVATGLFFSFLPPAVRFLESPLSAAGILAGCLRKPLKGAETTLHLASLPVVPGEGGTYWADKAPRRPNPALSDPGIVDEIWKGTAGFLDNP